MGLAGRKEKQRIGEDPRNIRWSKNESNPGFKILSSMGWSTLTPRMGASQTINSTWKRLPGSALPIIKSDNSGLGANPTQAPSNTYLLGAPRFVPSSQSTVSSDAAFGSSSHSMQDDPERSNKVAIVGNGGGFDDLLSRLNQSNKTKHANQVVGKENEEGPKDDSFVLVPLEETTTIALPRHRQVNKLRSIIRNSKNQTNRIRKRVRILELCQVSKKRELPLGEDFNDEVPHKVKRLKKKSKVGTNDLDAKVVKTNVHKVIEKNTIINTIHPPPTHLTNLIKNSHSLTSNLTRSNKIDSPKQPLNLQPKETSSTSVPLQISRPINPRLASRAKYIKSKQMANSLNSTAMAEILGIPPTF